MAETIFNDSRHDWDQFAKVCQYGLLVCINTIIFADEYVLRVMLIYAFKLHDWSSRYSSFMWSINPSNGYFPYLLMLAQ